MSPPKHQPKFFIDRSLGRVAVPAGLRDDGWDVVTLAEHYGMPRDEEVADTEWIADAASRGWPILMKDGGEAVEALCKARRHRYGKRNLLGS